MPALARVGVLNGARPLPVPFRGHDGGEVACLSSVGRLRQEEEVVADPSPSIRPGLLGLAGPQSFRPSLASVLQALWPAN